MTTRARVAPLAVAAFVAACSGAKPSPRVPADVEQRAVEYAQQADRHSAAGEQELALELATRALLVRLASCGFDCPEPATSFVQLGDLRQANGQYDWAVRLYARALEILDGHEQTHGAWIAAVEKRIDALCSRAQPWPPGCSGRGSGGSRAPRGDTWSRASRDRDERP